MALRQGRCRNYGVCHFADDRLLQAVEAGAEFVCGNPECRSPLAESTGQGGPPDGVVRRRLVLGAGVVLLAGLGSGLGYYLSRPAVGGMAAAEVSGFAGGGGTAMRKPMEQWMDEFAAPPVQAPETLPPGKLRLAWGAVGRIKARSLDIDALKRAGQLVGSESGLLNPVEGARLTPEQRSLVGQENQDRRTLFAFVAEYSNPATEYERVANEYARNRWREWSPR